MAYLVAFVSAVVSGALFALLARLAGIEHLGVLLAIAVIGGGLQLLFLIAWFLHHTRPDMHFPTEPEELAKLD